MRGITRPCRHSLSPELREQWRSHLCGVCLTLRDSAGQASRVLTGYDMLIPSVLIEAQMGRAQTVTAGRCPLRGMRTAEVVPSDHPGARFAAGASLLNGASSLDDKVLDGDLPRWSTPVAARAASAARRQGRRLADELAFSAELFSDVARAATAAEATGRTLDDYLAPAGRAGGELFGHTAVVAGRPANEDALRRAGDAFGRLVHLLDAVDDYDEDLASGSFNPLAASGTSADEAQAAAAELVARVAAALDDVDLVDPGLIRELLGPVLGRSVAKRFPGAPREPASSSPRRSAASVAAALVAVPAVLPAIFGGRRGGRRPPRGYGDPYYGGGYGYRRGPSCCDMLACDCCANMACNDCCGGDDCCVCCC